MATMNQYFDDNPEIRKQLDYAPPSGGHGSGKGTPGATEFPADWSANEVFDRIRDTVLTPQTWYLFGTTVTYFKEHEGVWVGAVARQFTEEPAELITAFPLEGSEGVRVNPYGSEPYLLVRVYEDMIDMFSKVSLMTDLGKDERTASVLWVASNLLRAGEPYEGVIWMLEASQELGLGFSEVIYSNLLLMANDGYFNGTYTGASFGELIASEWREHYPGTWK